MVVTSTTQIDTLTWKHNDPDDDDSMIHHVYAYHDDDDDDDSNDELLVSARRLRRTQTSFPSKESLRRRIRSRSGSPTPTIGRHHPHDNRSLTPPSYRSTVNSGKHHSSPTNTSFSTQFFLWSDRYSHHNPNHVKNDREYDLKNARDAVVGSISALINFLKTTGVPKPSTDQLERNLEMGRYFATCKWSMDYIQCVESKTEDDLLCKVHLTVTAWESLCRYKALEYKRAYKHAYWLRYERNGNQTTTKTVSTATKTSSIATTNQVQSLSSSVTSNTTTWTSSSSSSEIIKEAIEQQIKLAEQCTSCQKKLYLVHKWQRRVLQRTKKAAVIEPQGYQAIRCL